MLGKKYFLQKLTSQTRFKSLTIKDTKFEGSSPPSVFIGSENYPNVYAGPMLSQESECLIYDSPEKWLPAFQKEDIINFRLNLLRCKQRLNVHDISSRFTQKLQDIALSKNSVYSHAELDEIPRGVSFSEEHAPYGPSAKLRNLETETAKWQKDLEKAYYDNDLQTKDAIIGLNKKGLDFTTIQRALSIGAFGNLKNRRLVPTKWSITATDNMLGKNALVDVRQNQVINEYRVYESNGLHNYYAILMTPTQWEYEAIEAFINLMDNKTYTFSDYEQHFGRKKYSDMGGCYYAQRSAIADKLRQMNEQAGAFVFREANQGYVPTGVWLCRELTKSALNTEPKKFENLNDASKYINSKLRLGLSEHKDNMRLIHLLKNQKRLQEYL